MSAIPDFVHLHVHSQYSILDGQASIQNLVDKAMRDGQPGIAVTDHGNMFGIKEFYNYVKKAKGKYKAKAAEVEKQLAALRDGSRPSEDPQAEIARCEAELADLRRKAADDTGSFGYSEILLRQRYQYYRKDGRDMQRRPAHRD